MGGGDLNLKKSWHPQTIKNQEKLWKAEQTQNQEVQKLNDLRREIEEEKSREELKRVGQTSGVLPKNDNENKLEWMYKSSTQLVNREEYLLGRTIDKTFEMLKEEEERKEQALVGVKVPVNHVEHECIPFSIRTYRNLESTEQVDLQRKILEDPLMLIKQREMESRRKLLENPVKLKELHRILKTEQMLKGGMKSGKERKRKKSKRSKKAKLKKSKKSKKHDSTGLSASSDSNPESISSAKDLDAELEKRYQKLIKKDEEFKSVNLSKLLHAKYETISRELDKAVRSKDTTKSHRKRNRSRSREHSTSRRQHTQHHSPGPRRNERGEYNRNSSPRSRHYRSKSNSAIRHRHRDDRITHKSRKSLSRSRSRSPIARRTVQSTSKTSSAKASSNSRKTTASFKMSAEDKEQRLQEMKVNAVWRDVERTKTVQKQREEDAKEEARNQVREFDREFASNQIRKAMSTHTSVEACIRSNIKNIQRASGAMNKHFTKK